MLINEVMYNPTENDNYYEWIELYNPSNQSINLSGWTITDNYAIDNIHPNINQGNGSSILPAKQFALITDQGTKLYQNLSLNNTLLLSVDDATIGNGLGNNNDYLILKNSTNSLIDAIEWGEESIEVPGRSHETVIEGNSLARFFSQDSDDTSIDFYEAINATPGKRNNESRAGTIEIELFPTFIAKPYHFQQYSYPIAIKINVQDFQTIPSFDLKTYITGEESNQPASQTWNGAKWQYADRYTHTFSINQSHYSHWLYLRFNNEYQAYQHHIKNQEKAMIHVKIRYDNQTKEITQPVFLLDMDESSSNGTKGGYIANQLKKNHNQFENKTIIIQNDTGVTTGLYRTENNSIDETHISLPGYYKLTSPVGKHYNISILDDDQTILHYILNQTIRFGFHNVNLHTQERDVTFDKRKTKTYTFTLTNTGSFNDSYYLSITEVSNAWNAYLEKKQVHLTSNESTDIKLRIKPTGFEKHSFSQSEITVQARSQSDPGLYDHITYYCRLIEPDLTIPTIKSYDEQRKETSTVSEGESIRIKAYCKNIGNENASNVRVFFYLDDINETTLLGTKYYELISRYQKYPSYLWDTHNVAPGIHTIWVVVDAENTISELDESNNRLSHSITIKDTSPSTQEKQLLITELYANTHSDVSNEYLCIHNPNNQSINISNWYLTPTPFKPRSDQQKIIFPPHTFIRPNTTLTITQNATAYHWETGQYPDFEYLHNANKTIPQLICEKTIYFSNNGDTIALKDYYNHTIDCLHYGNTSLNEPYWQGKAIPLPGTAEILIRKTRGNEFVDTNRSSDWIHPRIYRIGQSRFPLKPILCNGSITTFVSPDCSYESIITELNNANQSIYLNIYEISHPDLCQALINALKRDVTVQIFIEGSPIGGISDEQRLFLHRIHSYGARIRFIKNDFDNDIYSRYTFDHAKYVIIDQKTTIIESCNWVHTGIPTRSSFGNREWGIIINDEQIADYFLSVFNDDWNPNRADSISYQTLNLSLPPTTFMKDKAYYGSYGPVFNPITINEPCTVIPVLSPDNSREAICSLINSAEHSIYVQQLYIYKQWKEHINPFVEALINKSAQGITIKVIMNYNPFYESTTIKCNETKTYLEQYGIEVKYIYTNWSIFTNVHNKGLIVDNESVLISSINWNENSVMNNRETGIIVHQPAIATYYANVFFSDWKINETTAEKTNWDQPVQFEENNNTIYILSIFTMTFVLIARDWRKRRWT